MKQYLDWLDNSSNLELDGIPLIAQTLAGADLPLFLTKSFDLCQHHGSFRNYLKTRFIFPFHKRGFRQDNTYV